MSISAALAAIASAILGGVLLWTNPKRRVNRVFASLSWHAAIWLWCLFEAFTATEGVPWLRVASALGAFFPMHLWLLKEAVAGEEAAQLRFRWRVAAWVGVAVASMLLPFSSQFIPPESTHEAPIYGPAYYLFLGLLGAQFIALGARFIMQAQKAQGARRIELQVIVIGGCAMALTMVVLIGLAAVMGNPGYVRLVPVVFIALWAGTVWAVTTTRLFDARHILRLIAHRAVLVGTVAVVGWGLMQVLDGAMPGPAAYVSTVAVSLALASWLSGQLSASLSLGRNGRIVRRQATEIAKRETQATALEREFVRLLKQWARADSAVILSAIEDRYAGGNLTLPYRSPIVEALVENGWATPERLARQRLDVREVELQSWMRENGFGVAVASGTGAEMVIVAVEVSRSRRPFTYPEVVELRELAVIIESALARLRLSVKVQQSEQLAIVGTLAAGVAHEIRNPLVSIKLFTQHLPLRWNDENFRTRFSSLIGSEVARIERLTEGMMDLAHPRTYELAPMPLHEQLHECVSLIQTRADQKGVEVRLALADGPDEVWSDPQALRQVVLNLGLNGIQAAAEREEPRWVCFTTRRIGQLFEIEVGDSGPGISPEVRHRLFQPFQTTKSSGFGLGLAMCRDIVSRIHATIAVDPPEPGRGAVFRVQLPCQQPSS